jgi:hypothetical protein
LNSSTPGAAGADAAADDAIELPWSALPLAEALPRIAGAEEFIRTYGVAVHLHDLVSRLTGAPPAEARRLLMQSLISVDGQVVQAWTADLKPGAVLRIRDQAYRVGAPDLS